MNITMLLRSLEVFRMSKVCNEDCFNCQYKDCILEDKDVKPERQLSQDPENIKRRERWRANKERYNATKRAYYAANRESINAKRRKPPKEEKLDYKGLCASCNHFIHKSRGKRGGLWGICDKSSKDCREYAEWGFLRPVGYRNKCSKYEELVKGEKE